MALLPPKLEPWADIGFVLVCLAWSGIGAHHPRMWALEITPVLLGLGIVFKLRHRFPLSSLVQKLLTLFVLLFLTGAHYSFSEVPAGFWLQDLFQLQRNPFDRISHFVAGFVSAIVFRELFVRVLKIPSNRAVFTLATSCALGFSAAYELAEFGAWKLILLRHTQVNVLGTQGDMWDTQWDMFLALSGALIALLTLAATHNASMDRLSQPSTEDNQDTDP